MNMEHFNIRAFTTMASYSYNTGISEGALRANHFPATFSHSNWRTAGTEDAGPHTQQCHMLSSYI